MAEVEKKKFVEPELIKFDEPLDKVTLFITIEAGMVNVAATIIVMQKLIIKVLQKDVAKQCSDYDARAKIS